MASSKRPTRSPQVVCAWPVATDTARGLTPAWLYARLVEDFRLEPGNSLTLAYSGGMDSEVLLHLLAGLHRETGWPIQAVHVNHGLSRNASAWAAHCTERCNVLRVPLRVERVQLTTRKEEGMEAAARRARYAVLSQHIGSRGVLLTAQHQRDQAETLLLRLLRGAGCRGMSAMPSTVRLGGGQLVRPLLDVHRDAIECYAMTHGIAWVDDEMNRDPYLARAFLRENVMPTLRRFWPSADAQFARAASNAAEAAVLLDELAELDLVECRADDSGTLSIKKLHRLSSLRRKNALRLWFVQQDRARPSSHLLAHILKMIEQSPASAKALVRDRETEVRRYRDQLRLASVDGPEPLRQWRVLWDPTQPLRLPARGGNLRAIVDSGRGISQIRLAGRLLDVRFRRGGEMCQLPGRAHRHKVKKLMQAAGIPPWERETLPFVYVDDELAAVGQDWICAPFAAAAGEPSLRFVIDRDAV